MHYVHKLKRSTLEKIVGYFILFMIIVVAATAIGVGIQNKIFVKEYRIISIIKEGHGIQAGTVVKLAGIDIGKVTDINFTHDNKIRIIMKLNKKFQDKIRKDSVAYISSTGLVGSKHINITLGDVSLPRLEEEEIIHAIEPVEIGDLGTRLNTLIEKLENILTETYGTVHQVNKTSVRELNAALKNVKLITEDVKKSRMLALMNDEAAYKSLKDSVDKLNQTMENLKKASEKTPGVVDKAGSIVEEVNKIIKAVQKHWLIRSYVKEEKSQKSSGETEEIMPEEISSEDKDNTEK